MALKNLDGEYKVESKTSYGGPFLLNADGVTTIKNGLTYRQDENGCTWESAFSPISATEVEVESTVDPGTAAEGVFVSDADGNPTREIVVYKSTLQLNDSEGKIIMNGIIQHGNETTEITLTQI